MNDINNTLAQILNIIDTSYRQTRDGSHLTEEAIQSRIDSTIKEMNVKTVSTISKADTDTDFNASMDKQIDDLKTKLKDLGVAQEEQIAIINDATARLKSAHAEEISAIQNYTKIVEAAAEKLRNAATEESQRNVASVLTNGASDKWARQGESMKMFGNSLSNLGHGKIGNAFNQLGGKLMSLAGGGGAAGGAMGGAAGGAMGSAAGGAMGGAAGGAMGGVAGKVPWAAALKFGCDLVGKGMQKYGEYLQHQARQQEFENQKAAATQQKNLALAQSFGELQQANAQNEATQAKNKISSMANLAVEGNAIVQNAKAAATETGLQSLTDIAGGAFAAAAQQIDIDTSVAKFNKKMETQKTIVEAKNALSQQEYELKQQNIEAKNATARTAEQTSKAMINQKQEQEEVKYVTDTAADVATAIPMVNDFAGELVKGGQAIRDGQNALDNARLEGVNQERNYQAKLEETHTNIRTSLQGTANDFAAFGKETVANMQQSIYDAEQEAKAREEKAWLNFTQQVFNAFQKSETAAYQMGRAFGYNDEQLHTYAKTLSATQVTVSKWGKNMEDMMKLQTSYQETTGRNTIFSEEDFNKSFANGLLMGDDVVSQLNAGMEPFNKSVSDSNEMFYEMYRNVTKMGLSGKKYAKDLVQNLKLAEKYNFNGGVKSLMEMSKWAQNVRFNTSSLDGMLNKVQEGGLEGIIKQSAELQVLGGNFASGSDPLAMAYESFMDPEAYAKRLNGMLAGQGVMDSNTGEVSFGIASQQIMRQMAKSTGQDYKDVLAQAKQQVKVNKIKGEVSQNFDENQLAAIANNAKYENGEWLVTMADGKTRKNVGDITAEDVSSLSGNEDTAKSMDENIANMRSTQELMKGTQDEILAKLEQSQWDSFRESSLQMVENISNHFNEDLTQYETNIKQKMQDVVTSQQTMVNQIMGNDPTDKTISAVKKAVDGLRQDVSANIGNTNSHLQTIIGGLEGALDNFKKTGDENAHSAAIETFHKNMMKRDWLTSSKTEDTAAYGVMKELYDNFEEVYKEIQNSKSYTQVDKNIMLQGISYWNPSGWHGSAKISQSTYDKVLELIGMGPWYQSLYKDVFDSDQFDEGTTMLDDGLISSNGSLSKINDGLVVQNGVPVRIDNNDQVLAAKKGGPLDRMLDMVQPRPMKYDSFVSETPYNNGSKSNNSFNNGNSELKISPIQIQITGNFNVNGSSVDFSSQLNNDPKLKEVLWSMISTEVAKKVGNTGKMVDPLYNRIQSIT